MPICKNCLKGFDSDFKSCPHCEHDQSKRSYRLIIFISFLLFSAIIFYDFCTQKITVKVDGKVYSDYLVLTGNRINSDINEGEIRIFHLFHHDKITIFLKEFNGTVSVEKGKDCILNIDSKAKIINVKSGNFFWSSEFNQAY